MLSVLIFITQKPKRDPRLEKDFAFNIFEGGEVLTNYVLMKPINTSLKIGGIRNPIHLQSTLLIFLTPSCGFQDYAGTKTLYKTDTRPLSDDAGVGSERAGVQQRARPYQVLLDRDQRH